LYGPEIIMKLVNLSSQHLSCVKFGEEGKSDIFMMVTSWKIRKIS
jgi:hypothetical protein